MAEARMRCYDLCNARLGHQEYYRILCYLHGGFRKIEYRMYYGYRHYFNYQPMPNELTDDWDDFNQLLLRLLPNVKDKTMDQTNEDGTLNFAYALFNDPPEQILNNEYGYSLFRSVFMLDNGQWRIKKKIVGDGLSQLYHHIESFGNVYCEHAVVLRLFAFIRYQHNARRHQKRRRDGHARQVANLLINLFDKLHSVQERRGAKQAAQQQTRLEKQNRARDMRAAAREARRNEAENSDWDTMITDIFR